MNTMPTILRGNALCLPVAESSVDLVVTSPPYFGLRSYQDGGQHYAGQLGAEATPAAYVDALITCTREWLRVLKPGGSLWINLGDKYVSDNRGSGTDYKRGEAKWAPVGPGGYPGEGIMPRKSLMGIPWRYALRCIDDLGLILRAEVIWSKPNGLPESVTDRVRRSHETWFHFVKQPRYFAAVDEIREDVLHPNWSRPNRNDMPSAEARRALGQTSALRNVYTPNALGKLPGSVWEVATQPLKVPADLGVDHFAAFPMEWPRRIILGWSPPGGVVLDPFGGTGTAALVATMLGRTGISVDMSGDYCRLAEWRATDAKERARAAGLRPEQVAKIDRVVPDQFDLFGETA